jgi:hypothetical protein
MQHVIDPALPVFRPCLVCHALLLMRVWHHGTAVQAARWEELPAGGSPITGTAHACGAEGKDC